MLTLYFGTKPLFLSSHQMPELAPYLDDKGTIQLTSPKKEDLNALIRQMQEPKTGAGVIFANPEQALELFKEHFVLIQAAGGLVYTDTGAILMIYRRGKWDLPKGKLDEDESLDACALREVEEETGLNSLLLQQKICVTYHTYYQDGAHILKESHWYLMKAGEDQEFIPQTEEDIEKCEWVMLENLAPYLENTHPSIIDVLKSGVPLISKTSATQ